MDAFKVTATQTASAEAGMAMVLKVVTGASGAIGATALATGATPNTAITPQATGSWVYGCLLESTTTALTAEAVNSPFEQAVTGAGLGFYQFRTISTTTASTPVTMGATGTTHGLHIVLCEILSAGTLAEDASSPAVSGFVNATSATTAAFTPPWSSLLVLMVNTNGNATVSAISVTDTSGLSLNWVQQVSEEPAGGGGYSGVWTAQLPLPVPSAALAARIAVSPFAAGIPGAAHSR